jgi:hypothetical protein
MDQSDSNASWIGAYMDWTDADSWTFGTSRLAGSGLGEGGVDVGGEFVAAYLDWTNAWQLLCESSPQLRTAGSGSDPDGIDASESGIDMLWDALMVALHTDSDCMPFLRQIIDDADNATPRAVIAA